MCGLCGVLRLDGAAPDVELCERMNARLVHRGPDGEGAFADGPVALAMRRLAVIDLPGADQPLHNEDASLTLVGNGEIYNYRALRRDLAAGGHRLATHGDLETALHLYEEHELGFAEHLRGMFALALWDAPRRRLVLVRDRYGIKPLYVRRQGASLAFASELGAIAADPGLPREIDPEALWLYLSRNCVPAPRTILRGVEKLEPGHMLVAEDGEVRVRRWYRRPLPAAGAQAPKGAEALANELRWKLEDSVRAHLEADVPVGVFLSGGVDSGTLCALAAGVVSGPLRTFSIGFRERSFDELADARATAARYGTRHTEEILAPDALSLLPRLVEAYDEPFADSSAVPTFLVSELAARDVKVVLSGEGGDEAFGGYEVYLADRLAPLVGRALPRPVRAGLVEPLVGLLPSSSRRASLDYRAKRFLRDLDLPPLDRHAGFKLVLTEDVKAELVRPPYRSAVDPLADLRRHYGDAAGVGPLARLQHVDAMTYLSDDLLTKTDRASMAHSLEARVPFVDDRVLDFAGTLPDGVQVRGLQKKWLLRRAVRPLLPRQVVDGRKRGFSIPAARWLRHDARELVIDHLSAEPVRRQGVFEPAVVERLVREHLDGRVDHSRPLWGLLVFSLWHESMLAPAPVRTAVSA